MDTAIKEILRYYKKIAVVGLSPHPNRPSHSVTQYMIGKGYDIVGVRPGGLGKILGRPCYENLMAVPGPLEIINVFRNVDAIPALVDEIENFRKARPIGEWPKVLWLQLGITHPASENRAREMGMQVVSDRCILVEHKRLFSK